ALDATLSAVDEARHAALLAARGIALGPLRALTEALRGAPTLEDGFGAAHADVFQRAMQARRALADALTLASLAPDDLERRRRRRLGALGLGVLAAILLPVTPLPEMTRVRVWASGQWAYDAHFPQDAVDGDPETEWHGVNQQAGWLDLRVSPPQDIERLRFLNGHNPPFDDRGCAVVRLRLYRRGEEVVAFNRRFSSVEHAPEWVVFEVGEEGIDRIRVEVPVFHRMGPAIAEVGWE
ncbi:MAG: hypothetical protein KC619_17245, partial [Myxococcales bacterium]|nr:hypothetical protein [Myxococcales bacterium]